MSKNLPVGWAESELGDCLLSIVGGGTPSRNVATYFEGAIPWFTVKDMKSPKPSDAEEHISEEAVANSATNVVPPNTLICATRIALGRAIRPTVECAINQDLKALIVGDGVDSDFLLYWILANEQVIQREGTGTTVSGIRLETLRSLPLLLPPSLEQTRIVEKLEELLSDLDAGMAELKDARRKLNRYRQSLLKSAVEGTLTADWRAANGEPEETGTELLQRILSERRAGWEKKQLAKLNEQRKAPPKNWRARYAEPVQPDQDKLPTLPENWAWASLDQLLIQLRSGSAETSIREVTPFPILKSSAVRQGSVDFSALNYVTEKQSREENVLALHDLLITRLSGSVEYVGCCVTIDHLPDGAVQYPDRIFCGKMTPGFECLGTYISYWLRSPMARTRIEAAAKSTAGHKRISMSDLQPFPIPLPPLDELDVITRRLENFSAQIATLHESVFSGLLQATAQRKNVLKAAFAGQLVSQDPNEEPASELLARIRAARDTKASGSVAAKRGRESKVTP